MTYNQLLDGTFTGVIISEIVAKDGHRIGFISPNSLDLVAAITAWKVNAGRNRCDGNIQFVFPREGQECDYTAGNAKGLRKNMQVSFKIRYDANMPQAYQVQPIEVEIIPSITEFKPLEAKPQADALSEISEAAALAYGEADEEEDFIEEPDPSEEDFLAYDDYE